ncbi:N-acetylmuramoyl-L-alanine amidase family protein [Sulfuriroseicoccus oceanibius]|uniref:N-acetylmuramoyl-L-alanine amidase n=1 Tax=Sulfuriroseicoccus oceanibius TaxID=2707525 RepID=A0A6B3LAH9_9BACT|nr:N-acetylmuramoyl-L-alanine amidase [Sulfuriroseicoccus oceanibius]QQL46221.1 N-acetylmuramoyl-L-alanine amidase [Sulfuriroseicoccus oceanibius]
MPYPRPAHASLRTSSSGWWCALMVALVFIGTAVARTVIVIDAGHGGIDKGAYWGGVRESRVALATAKELEKELKRRGFRTVMTRRTDKFVPFSERAQIANRYPKAIFVSIHYNASTNRSVRGIETYYLSRKGRKLASNVQTAMMEHVRSKDRGIRRRNFKVLRDTKHPAILVECGFISNSWERKRANSAWYQRAISKLIAEGIARYFGY